MASCELYLCQSIAYLNANPDGKLRLKNNMLPGLILNSIFGLSGLGCWLLRPYVARTTQTLYALTDSMQLLTSLLKHLPSAMVSGRIRRL